MFTRKLLTLPLALIIACNAGFAQTGEPKQHTVQQGETLYSIAHMYDDVSVQDLQKWNDLDGNGIKIDQVLKLSESKDSATSIVSHVMIADTLVALETPVDMVPELEVPPKVPIDTVCEGCIATVDYPDNFWKVPFDLKMLVSLKEKYHADFSGDEFSEANATARKLDDPMGPNQTKFYALHKTAPVGTVLKLTNLFNNRTVYVKVIGRLENNREHEYLSLKISAAAAKYLRAANQNFGVSISGGKIKS